MAHYFVAESVLEKHRENLAVALGMAICTSDNAYDLSFYNSSASEAFLPLQC
jgi:hypothetical protein